MSSKENADKAQLQRNAEGGEQVHRQVDNQATAPSVERSADKLQNAKSDGEKAMLSRSIQRQFGSNYAGQVARQTAVSRAPAAAPAKAAAKRSELQGDAYYAWIGRSVAYQNQSVGAIIPGPKSGGPESYRVSAVIDDNKSDLNPLTKDGSGFYGFVLEPVGVPKGGKGFPGIMALRGTEPGGGAADILTDANPAGIGANQFAANKIQIGKALTDSKTTTGQGAIVCGHSLGGALAQLTTASFTDKISGTYTFNAPGIPAAAGNEFEANKKKMAAEGKGAQTPEVTNYVMEGDKVSIAGETFLGNTKLLTSPVSAQEKIVSRQLLDIYDQIKTKAARINELRKILLTRKVISATTEIASLMKEIYDLIKKGVPLAKSYPGMLNTLHTGALPDLGTAKNVGRNHTINPEAEALRKKIGTALDVFRNGINRIPGFNL